MRLLLLISLSLLLLVAQKVCAQLAPADDFFNSGAQFYISNNIPAAKERVETGLQMYPNDEKLKKLEELLKQQQQSQNSQSQQNQKSQSQQQKSSGQQNQKQQNQSSSQQNSENQQKQNEEKQKAEQQKQEQQKQAERQKSAAEKKNDEEQKNEEGQPVEPGQMTPQEAKRLLDSQKGDEQVLQLKPEGKPQDNQKPVKDW